MEDLKSDFIFLENLITELNEPISCTKPSYYINLGKSLITHYCKQKPIGHLKNFL